MQVKYKTCRPVASCSLRAGYSGAVRLPITTRRGVTMQHRRQWLSFAAATLALAGRRPLTRAGSPGLPLFPVNQYGLELTARYWNPIIEYITAKSGVKLQLKIGRTSADTTAYVLANEVEFVFSNHLFSPDRDHLGWKVFGRRRNAAHPQPDRGSGGFALPRSWSNSPTNRWPSPARRPW